MSLAIRSWLWARGSKLQVILEVFRLAVVETGLRAMAGFLQRCKEAIEEKIACKEDGVKTESGASPAKKWCSLFEKQLSKLEGNLDLVKASLWNFILWRVVLYMP